MNKKDQNSIKATIAMVANATGHRCFPDQDPGMSTIWIESEDQ